jgi:hypothetical protein
VKRPPVLAHLYYQQWRAELESRADLIDKFSYIHEKNLWGADESRSGLGSSLDATEQVRAALGFVCEKYRINRLVDLPCGDAAWIHCAGLPINEYVGGDIVPEIIQRNQGRRDDQRVNYSVEYKVMDITRDDLPFSDLILCRDCLVHLSFKNIEAALMNVAKSGARYLMTTTFPLHEGNIDIQDGDWRLLNFEGKPFFLPPPLEIFNEGCEEQGGAYADKSLALWEVSQVRSAV